MWTNYHSHCHYCDGVQAPEAHIVAAIDKGFHAFGFSSHGPMYVETGWNIRVSQLEKYTAEIKELKRIHHHNLDIYIGLEMDYIPGIIGPKAPIIEDLDLDYTIGSIHFVDSLPAGAPWMIDSSHAHFMLGLNQVFGGDIQAAVRRYYELTQMMVKEECPDVIGHMDKIKIQGVKGQLFTEQELWYREAVIQTLEVIRDSGAIVEVNTRGMYKQKTLETYPSHWVLVLMKEMNIPIMLNSDSHHPSEIGYLFPETARMLNEIGYTQVKILQNNEWKDVPFSAKGIEMDTETIIS